MHLRSAWIEKTPPHAFTRQLEDNGLVYHPIGQKVLQQTALLLRAQLLPRFLQLMQVLTGHQGFPPSRKSVRLGIGSTFVGNLGMLKHVAVQIPVSLPGHPGFKCTVIHHESRCPMCKYNMIIKHSVYIYIYYKYICVCVCARSTCIYI